uniref:Uncharacterized protein n=1 Tax=Riboviria sp. TaxID=2585031 RepID=A0A893AB48_9VIRU|nr:MAG: hypothetical protein 2 [Riboviria sp.]QRQ90159.1 MAG: hypothetical protein 2 [Riboviria sp.]
MGNVETHQLATFADDSSLVSGAKPAISGSGSWRSFAEESRTHGILDILSRPVLLTDSTSIWSTSKPANAYPTDAISNSVFTFPTSILNKSANIVRKLAGFTYFKADVKVRVMVNAQAFSQGKLWIWFSPYELGAGTQTSADNLAAKTGYPGVELDVASGVPVEFSIPYCAPNSHYTLTSGEGTMGDLFLTVLSPLTISDASISVFAWFENIDLTMPTGVERGVIPDEYFVIDQRGTFERAEFEVTSDIWGGLVLDANNDANKVVLKQHLLLVTSAGNFIVLPPGMSISGKIETLGTGEALRIKSQSNPLGISGYAVTDVLGNDYECSMLNNASSYAYGFDPARIYNTDTPLYLFGSSTVNLVLATQLTIPNVIQCPVNVESTSTGYLMSFNTSGKAIYIYPPYSKVKYLASAKVSINSGAVVGDIRNFTGSSNTLFQYASSLNTTTVMIVAQSDSKDEDEWYKEYPRAQASEAEAIAMTGVVTNAYKTLKSMSQLPMLSSLTAPLSWVSRIGSLASSGFSKPTDVQAIQPFFAIPAKGFTHITGQDASVALAAIPDNSVGVSPGVFSTSIDEMDINYVCKKSCFLRRDDWTNTTVGRIFSIFVSPGICATSDSFFQPSLLAYVTSMFRYWHGSMRYRISVAKTGFHTGRLRISYHPGALSTGQSYSADNAYSWILDLSVTSEIDVEIPYVSPKPWLSCDLFNHTSTNPFGPNAETHALVGSNNLQFCTGVLQVEVLNQLRVAGAASNTVEILTWVSSGDIEFAVPIMSSFVPCRTSATIPTLQTRVKRTASIPPMESVPEEIIAECTLCEEESTEEIPEAQAFQNITPASDHMTQLDGSEFCRIFNASNAFSSSKTLCIGESVSNLRELTRRFTPCALKVGSDENISPLGVVFDPAWFGTLVSATIGTNVKVFDSQGYVAGAYTNCTAPIEYISKIYRFWRGSRRYKGVSGNSLSGDSTKQNFVNQAYLSPVSFVNGNVTPPTFFTDTTPPEDRYNINSVFSHFVDGSTNRVVEISVPYYSDTPIQCVSDGTNFINSDSYCIRNKVVFSNGPTANNTAKQMMYYMAAGDDFSFGYLIGAPLLRRIVKPFEFPVDE